MSAPRTPSRTPEGVPLKENPPTTRTDDHA